MSKTRQITINSTAPTEILVQSNPGCARVRILENQSVSGFPTTDLLVYKQNTTDTPVQITAGREYDFEQPRLYQIFGARVGWVKTVTGSTTLDVDES